MEEKETKAVDLKEVTAPVPHKPESKTQKPKPKPKPRDIEELDTIDPKKMSEIEKNKYIVACRTALTKMNNQYDSMSKNCQQAYEQFRNADEAYKKLNAEYNTKVAYCKQVADTCSKAISAIGGPHC